MGDPEHGQIAVEESVLGVEQPDPDEADHGRRDDVGREQDRPGETRERPALVDEKGEAEAGDDDARDDDRERRGRR